MEGGCTRIFCFRLKLIPSLQRLEPELTAKMTDEELLEEVNDTLFKVLATVIKFYFPNVCAG